MSLATNRKIIAIVETMAPVEWETDKVLKLLQEKLGDYGKVTQVEVAK